jgi:hypothetical protein
VTGLTYRITVSALALAAINDACFLNIIHNSATIGLIQFGDGGTNTAAVEMTARQQVIFVAAASTLTFTTTSWTASSFLRGNNTDAESWAMIEELNNYGAASTDFT